MASYDLKCRACGKEFEVFQLGFLKQEAKVCPECGGGDVEQLFTGFGGFTGLQTSAPSCAEGGCCRPQSCPSSSGCGYAG